MKRANQRHRRQRRREEAEIRQAEYDALTIEQKIARAKGRPGDSRKEIKRLREAA